MQRVARDTKKDDSWLLKDEEEVSTDKNVGVAAVEKEAAVDSGL